jgi:alpha-methylacyl-CoA racemase
VKVVELAGIGPGPYCGMMLADLGAEVVRVDRVEHVDAPGLFAAYHQVLDRGRRSIALDLKRPEGVAAVLRLVDRSDVIFEGFRPGVAERLGIGPDVCLQRNPRIVYGRMTGWGQNGPLASTAGHDINYIALAGALGVIGRAGEAPVPPVNLVGDFGGGGLLLAFGIVCALLETRSSGIGQVVDAAIVDGAASLMSMLFGMRAAGHWREERGTNLLDTGAPFYDVYRCADGEYVAVGALEDRFFAELIAGLGLDSDPDCADRNNPQRWPAIRRRFQQTFAARTRDEWAALFADRDACVSPVLSMREATAHSHNVHRGTFSTDTGVVAPAPAPRFGRTPSSAPRPVAAPGEHTAEILRECGLSESEISDMYRTGVVR